MKNKANRNHSTGRYSYSNLSRPCSCGHTLGQHTSAAPHDCTAENCECDRFVPKPAETK